ncbi:hypothetical protein CSV80_12505 [Sporosarcina sp. P12(2017)]|nr:hypothetical protein CSV81_15635 [Sporosarcina sp. P10]PIC60057.1 hypothetical protein CSV80_12505 [Sporosarcina sp. P12(2017)]
MVEDVYHSLSIVCEWIKTLDLVKFKGGSRTIIEMITTPYSMDYRKCHPLRLQGFGAQEGRLWEDQSDQVRPLKERSD